MKKYGRTFHLPTSPGVGSDDKIIQDLTHMRAADEVVFTEKMDGENTTIFSGGCHARSPDSGAGLDEGVCGRNFAQSLRE